MTAGVWQKDPRYTLAVDVAASTDERTVLSIWKLTDGVPQIIATVSDPPPVPVGRVCPRCNRAMRWQCGECGTSGGKAPPKDTP